MATMNSDKVRYEELRRREDQITQCIYKAEDTLRIKAAGLVNLFDHNQANTYKATETLGGIKVVRKELKSLKKELKAVQKESNGLGFDPVLEEDVKEGFRYHANYRFPCRVNEGDSLVVDSSTPTRLVFTTRIDANYTKVILSRDHVLELRNLMTGFLESK